MRILIVFFVSMSYATYCFSEVRCVQVGNKVVCKKCGVHSKCGWNDMPKPVVPFGSILTFGDILNGRLLDIESSQRFKLVDPNVFKYYEMGLEMWGEELNHTEANTDILAEFAKGPWPDFEVDLRPQGYEYISGFYQSPH